MAFNARNLALLSSAEPEGSVYREFVYIEVGVTLATILGAGYFYDAGRDTANPDAQYLITDLDKVTIIGSNGAQETRVSDDEVGTVA